MPSSFRVRQIQPSDTEIVEELWYRRAGFEFGKSMERALDPEVGYYCLVATHQDLVIGFALVIMLREEYAQDYFRTPIEFSFPDLTAFIHAIAVDEDFEGKGVGTELMRRHLDACEKDPEVGGVMGAAWLRPGKPDSSSLFEKLGFQCLKTVENFYRDSNGESTRDCPECLPEPCSCSSAIYGKIL